MRYIGHVHNQHSWEADVALTQVDIDEDALTEAMRLSGARTKKETVNLALREYAARHRRVAALERYAALAEEWDFEGWEHRRAAEKDPSE
jgi:Arc/MetJ family transcription regulator